MVELFQDQNLDEYNDNIDVYVHFIDGSSYVATFFTLANIRAIMEKDKATGEACGGLYFWASDLVIVDRINQSTVESAVAALIEQDLFRKAFDGPMNVKDA